MHDSIKIPACSEIYWTTDKAMCSATANYSTIIITKDPYSKGGSITVNEQTVYVANLASLSQQIMSLVRLEDR